MKKILAFTVTVIMILSMSMTAFAAESITEKNGTKEIDVQAKAVYIDPADVYYAPVTDGKASVTTADGTKISVSTGGTELGGLTLNVIEMVKEDKEAYSWISGIMSGLCDKFTAYDIYFTDKDGNRVDVTGEVTMSITTPDGYKNVQVYHIGSDAKPDEIASEQSGDNTEFTASGFSYYVLAEKTNGGGTTDLTKPGNPNSPQTGDNSNMMLWFALLIISGGIPTTLGITKKRKKATDK